MDWSFIRNLKPWQFKVAEEIASTGTLTKQTISNLVSSCAFVNQDFSIIYHFDKALFFLFSVCNSGRVYSPAIANCIDS